MNTKMNQQPMTRMGNMQQERRVGAGNEKMDVFVHIRATPSQINELRFPGSSTAAIQPGTTAYSISGSTFSGVSSGVQLAEIESGAKDEEIRIAKLCCGGGCCIIFSPLAKIAALLSPIFTCCCC